MLPVYNVDGNALTLADVDLNSALHLFRYVCD